MLLLTATPLMLWLRMRLLPMCEVNSLAVIAHAVAPISSSVVCWCCLLLACRLSTCTRRVSYVDELIYSNLRAAATFSLRSRLIFCPCFSSSNGAIFFWGSYSSNLAPFSFLLRIPKSPLKATICYFIHKFIVLPRCLYLTAYSPKLFDNRTRPTKW